MLVNRQPFTTTPLFHNVYMKHPGKIVLLVVFIFALFFYRSELSGLANSPGLSRKSTIDRTDWSGAEFRERAEREYKSEDPEQAIITITEYLSVLEEELRRHDYQYENLATRRHDIICELSLVHNKLSNSYYHLSDTDNYYLHEARYRDYLSQCSDYEEDLETEQKE